MKTLYSILLIAILSSCKKEEVVQPVIETERVDTISSSIIINRVDVMVISPNVQRSMDSLRLIK